MTRKLTLKLAAALLMAAASLASCGKDNGGSGTGGGSSKKIWPRDGLFLTKGAIDTVDFTYALLKDKPMDFSLAALKSRPVHVVYYIPKGFDVKRMPILFSMTGAERVGATQIDAWKPFANKYGFIIVNPQFLRSSDVSAKNADGTWVISYSRQNIYRSAGAYWLENDYQFGHVATSKNSPNLYPRNTWAYNIIELLFDYICHEIDSAADGYYMFGHSAGAQFVNRMVMAFPEARIKRAVAANPSSWAWPVLDGEIHKMNDNGDYLYDADGTTPLTQLCGWPYCLKSVYTKPSELAGSFSKQLFIQIGSKDVETNSLDTSSDANATGSRRLYRARNFYKVCNEMAAANNIKCNFTYAEVTGADHSTYRMVYGLPKGQYSSSRIGFDDLGANSAFLLLFRGVLNEDPNDIDED